MATHTYIWIIQIEKAKNKYLNKQINTNLTNKTKLYPKSCTHNTKAPYPSRRDKHLHVNKVCNKAQI